MKKGLLDSFVQRYNLDGSAESVLIISENGKVSTQFITDDKCVLGTVESSKVELDKGEYPIFDTAQLRRMLSVLEEEVTVKSENPGKNIQLSDGRTKVVYVLADKDNIPKSGGLKKLPPFEMEITIDNKFINTFVKGSNALPDVETFTILASDKDIRVVLGYQENVNTNKITIEPETVMTKACEPMSFSSRYLRAILLANKDTKGTLKISSAGLIHIHYVSEEYDSNYYIAKLDRKD